MEWWMFIRCRHLCKPCTVYWESFTEQNIHEFYRFWNDCECFLATIFYLLIVLTKNVCTVLIFQTWKELRLPDPASRSLKWNDTIHVNQRARLPNEVKANRKACKSAEKCMCTILYGNTWRKANRHTLQKWNDKCISQRIFLALIQ